MYNPNIPKDLSFTFQSALITFEINITNGNVIPVEKRVKIFLLTISYGKKNN